MVEKEMTDKEKLSALKICPEGRCYTCDSCMNRLCKWMKKHDGELTNEARRELLEKFKQRKWLVKCPNCDPKQIGEKVKGKCPYCKGAKGVYMIPLSYIEELEKELKSND